ncbi:MAG: hypothetical protein E5299_01129 [Burkholderia gladioli]|nr:MAG: hypothetical protein E5299_01129 [Burkholderia gladioli]
MRALTEKELMQVSGGGGPGEGGGRDLPGLNVFGNGPGVFPGSGGGIGFGYDPNHPGSGASDVPASPGLPDNANNHALHEYDLGPYGKLTGSPIFADGNHFASRPAGIAFDLASGNNDINGTVNNGQASITEMYHIDDHLSISASTTINNGVYSLTVGSSQDMGKFHITESIDTAHTASANLSLQLMNGVSINVGLDSTGKQSNGLTWTPYVQDGWKVDATYHIDSSTGKHSTSFNVSHDDGGKAGFQTYYLGGIGWSSEKHWQLSGRITIPTD